MGTVQEKIGTFSIVNSGCQTGLTMLTLINARSIQNLPMVGDVVGIRK